LLEGIIQEGKAYSDCLFPEFIESMNQILNSGKFSYDAKGIKEFCQELGEKNPKQAEYVNQLESWLHKKI